MSKKPTAKPSSGGAHTAASAANASSQPPLPTDEEHYELDEERVQDWRDELDDFERRLAGKSASGSKSRVAASKSGSAQHQNASATSGNPQIHKKSLRGKGDPLPPIGAKPKKGVSEEEIEVAREQEEARAAVASLPDLPDSP
eukprot:TRINITY_DN5297_c0_g2_i3.p1 TRINITY_DN5297_c0_g2~~TRINITY_DN5297_c0_g2_i3.p1  ORF type:complete len:143 (-),score=37.68 TRINITY_DN5297_c0_g2_i3:387-815(-)